MSESNRIPYSRRLQDLTGMTFGRWTVINRSDNLVTDHGNFVLWNCKCECGVVRQVKAASLKTGDSQSCGCLPEYKIWLSMKDRCNNPRNKAWQNYGGRGIRVCERWSQSFTDFLGDIGYRPSGDMTIDRIDNNRGYEPNNCRWTTRTINNRNVRDNVIVEYVGVRLCIAEWSERLGISTTTLGYRLRHWSVSRALTEPVKKRQWRSVD